MQLNALSQDYISSEKHPTEKWFDIHESIVVMLILGQRCYFCTTYIWIVDPSRGVTRQIEYLILSQGIVLSGRSQHGHLIPSQSMKISQTEHLL
jgi:hypothetical protein